MGRIKRFFGCGFLMFGGMFIAHTFMSAPYNMFEAAVVYIVFGLIFAFICIYFGLKWVELEVTK
ncbi:hypothetical protein KAW18_02575 [candidate division WOR-3 bacterium]|nr:hypothetical protein [candidate division WOR-3 bacterium]